MMIFGFGSGVYYLCQGLGYIAIKNSNDLTKDKLSQSKSHLIFLSVAMFGIGIIYTLEFVGIW